VFRERLGKRMVLGVAANAGRGLIQVVRTIPVFSLGSPRSAAEKPNSNDLSALTMKA
jgi:hypothetical protein